MQKYPINTLRSASSDNFALFLADIISEYNAIHPFREGNGRSIRALAMLLAEHCGHPMDWTPITRDQWAKASVESFYGSQGSMTLAVRQALGLTS